MAASVSVAVIDGAPGNIITVNGTGLVSGGSANVTLNNQGVTATPDLASRTITLPAVFNTTNVQIGPLPDEIVSGTLTVTAGDGTLATCALRAVSQYVQASEYIGEGEDVEITTFQPGELDVILRRASGMCDSFMNGGLRIVQALERHRYKARPNGAPFIIPFRTRGRRVPIISIDQLTFVSAIDLVTVFNPNDMYVNQDLNYIEVLAYAVGNYALVGQLQVIGYSANVFELSFTSGYTMATYPNEIRMATIMTATMLINRRRRQSMGLGPFADYGDGTNKLTIDQKGVTLPHDARLLLLPFVASSLG